MSCVATHSALTLCGRELRGDIVDKTVGYRWADTGEHTTDTPPLRRDEYDGWLSPGGHLFVCDDNQAFGHYELARRIKSRLFKDDPRDHEVVLEDAGWVKVTRSEVVFYSWDKVSEAQAKTLMQIG